MSRLYPHYNFNDFDLIVKDNVLYATYVKKTPYPQNDPDSKKPNTWGLAKSKDGVNWKEVGTLLRPVRNSWEESLWAGSVSKQGKGYAAYYTGVSARERESSSKIGKAYSSDLVHWRKDPKNPVLEFDEKNPYYSSEPKLAFRDPFFFRCNGKRYLLLCAKDKKQPRNKKGCVGLFWEYGKNKFKALPPIFSPGKYRVLECPALYRIKEKWYLLYGDDAGGVFRYAFSRKPFGPHKEPRNNALHPKLNYASRIVKFRGKQLMYWWQRDFPKGQVRERLKGPKKVTITKEGKIKLINI